MELPENIVAVVGVDNAGNIVNIDASLFSTVTPGQIKQAASTDSPYTIAERTAPQLSPSDASTIGLKFNLTPSFFPIANDTGDNLEDSVMFQFMGKVGVNTRTPSHKFEVRGGSININQLIKTDGYKLSGVNFGYYEKGLSTIFMGNATTANMISMNALTLSGSKLVTPISKLRGIGVNDSGVVSTTMVRSDGTEFSVVNSSNATLATLTATAGLNLSTINHATTNTDKFLVSDAGVVKYRTAAEVLLDLDAVPYTGAYKNVNLGKWGITAGNFIFDITPTGIPTAQGSMYWDSAEETVALIMNGTTQRVGQDLFYPVKNQTGSTIPKGTGVRFAGTLGASGRLLIAPFIANGTYPSKYFMGLTAEDIPNGANGKVIAFGKVRKVNTFSFTNGDILYASTTVAGGFQTTAPTAPNNIVVVAAVVYADATNGELTVRVSPGSNISEDEGIKLLSLANKDVLQYNTSNSLWENKTLYAAGIAGLGTTTANTLAYFDTIGTLSSLSTSTYPSLTEISYVKGVTSSIQTQIDGKQPQLNGTGFVKASGTTITYDNSTYLTTISGITAGGELSGTYPNPTLVNAAVTNKVLTGLNVIGGSIAATDTILEGFGKLQNQLNALSGAVIYQGVWNASTNSPTLTSSVGTKGYYYIVNVAGSTSLNGTSDWKVGDWVIFDGTTWNKVDNTDLVTSVNGYIGAVSLTTSDIPEALTPVNLYFTNARSRAALSAGTGISYNSTTGVIASTITQYTDALARASLSFVAGSGAYNSTTGVITIPTNTTHLTNGANFTSGTLTSGYVPYATGAQSLSNSSIFYSSGRILIGSTTDDTINALQVTGSIKQTSATSAIISTDSTGKLISGGSGTANYLPLWATANTLTNSWIYHSVYHTSVNGIGFMPSGAASEVFRVESNGRVYIGASAGANASLALNIHAQGNTGLVTRFNAGNLYAMTRFMQDETNFRGVGTGYDVSEQAGFIYGTSPNSSTDSLLKFVVLDGSTGVWGITATVKKRTINFPNMYSAATGLATGDMYYDTNGILRLAGLGSGGSGTAITGAGTTNELAYFTSATNVASLPVATYPSLTELSYVKGVTSAIQTQLNAKQATLSLTSGYVPKATGTSTLGNSLIYDYGTGIGINTTSSGYMLNVNGTINAVGGVFFNGANSLIGSSYFKASSTLGFTVNNSADTQNNFISYDNGDAYIRGNTLLGTTINAGFRLDVNGTSRFNGLITLNSAVISLTNSSYFKASSVLNGFIVNDSTDTYNNFISYENGNALVRGTLTANSLVKSGGASSQFLKADGSVDSSTYLTTSSASSTYQPLLSLTSGYVPKATGTSTLGNSAIYDAGSNVLGIGTASPLIATSRQGMVIRGGSTGAEIVLQSTNSINGTYDGFSMAIDADIAYLYNKRNGNLQFGANNALKATLKTNGDFDITGAYLVNGAAILSGSGTSGYLSKWTSSSVIANSIVYDNGTNLTIGGTSALYKLTVTPLSNINFGVGVTSFTGTNNATFLNSTDATFGSIPMLINASILGFSTGYTEAGRIDGSQNWLIGGTGVTGGGKLQVTGDVNISGVFKINGAALSSGIGGSGTTGNIAKFSSTYNITGAGLYDGGTYIDVTSGALRIANKQALSDSSTTLNVGFTGFSTVALYANTTNRLEANSQGLKANLPTSSSGLASGQLWNDSGTVKIV